MDGGSEFERERRTPVAREDRRGFLKAAASLPFLAGARAGADGVARVGSPSDEAAAMPKVPLGKARISRLVAGSNTINAGSHLSHFVDLALQEYFTEERILAFLRRCERAGINLWQGSRTNYEIWDRHRRAGGKLDYISLGHGGKGDPLSVERAARMGFLGIVHHGEVTDRLFKTGRIEKARDYLKRVRDAGLLVGLSTHMPTVIDHVEEKGWDLDFYMTCVYERHRSREALRKRLGHVPIRVGEVYLEDDPPRMYERIRATKRTCLAFKILAAGRLCESREQVERAFETTLKNIKPTDAVIVGMWPRWNDQVGENAAFVRRFGTAPS